MRAFLTSESDAAAARADALAEELIRQEEAVQREAAERKGGRAANFSRSRPAPTRYAQYNARGKAGSVTIPL